MPSSELIMLPAASGPSSGLSSRTFKTARALHSQNVFESNLDTALAAVESAAESAQRLLVPSSNRLASADTSIILESVAR